MKKSFLVLAAAAAMIFMVSCSDEKKSDKEGGDEDQIIQHEEESEDPGNDSEESGLNESDTVSSDNDSLSDADSSMPGEQFFKNIAEKSAVFEFDGIINSLEKAAENNVEYGTGKFTVHVNDVGEIKEYVNAVDYGKFSEENSNPVMRNRSWISLAGTKVIELSNDSAEYYTFQALVNTENLKAHLAEGGGEFKVTDDLYAGVWHGKYKIRPDNVMLRKQCLTAESVFNDSVSKIFLQNNDNKDFSAGENLRIWGNIKLSDDINKIKENNPDFTEDNGEICYYMADNKVIDKATYESEMKNDGINLSCELPDNFFDPMSESYVIFKYIGEINDPATTSPKLPIGMVEVTLKNGEKIYGVDQKYLMLRKNDQNNETIFSYALNLIEQKAANHFILDAVDFTILKSEIDKMEPGTCIISNNPESPSIIANVSVTEQFVDKANTIYLKSCYSAATDFSSTLSKVALCKNESSKFEVGEEVEIAGNIVLTEEKEDIMKNLGIDSECGCANWSLNKKIECAEFDKVVGGE